MHDRLSTSAGVVSSIKYSCLSAVVAAVFVFLTSFIPRMRPKWAEPDLNDHVGDVILKLSKVCNCNYIVCGVPTQDTRMHA